MRVGHRSMYFALVPNIATPRHHSPSCRSAATKLARPATRPTRWQGHRTVHYAMNFTFVTTVNGFPAKACANQGSGES
jgi:hypothetical protein